MKFERKEEKQQKMNETKEEIDPDLAFPWRICLAGGWLDQPWVSELHPGCVITVNVKHNKEFKTRSGLGTSSRQCGIKLWGGKKPTGMTPVEAAK